MYVFVVNIWYIAGVPVSNQWDKNGYIYPIQVAQYGLSHFSKLTTAEGVKSDRYDIVKVFEASVI